jgi:hypothetical protein
MPNPYSLRICSNNSTFDLQSNEFLRPGPTPNQSTRSSRRVGQIKLPNWATWDAIQGCVSCFRAITSGPSTDNRLYYFVIPDRK